MKRILFLFCLLHFAGKSFGQRDSLFLVLTSKYTEKDSANSYYIQIDFISKKRLPVSFIYTPSMELICCKEPGDAIGIDFEKLEDNCYVHYSYCADCDPIYSSEPKIEKRILNYGDTVGYTANIPVFSRIGINRKATGFLGVYRCKVWRMYQDAIGTHKISSNWLYISFPEKNQSYH